MWILAALCYQIKIAIKGGEERSLLGFVKIVLSGKLKIAKVLFEGSKWEDFRCKD